MIAMLHLIGMFIIDLFKSRSRLEAENLFLRHQSAKQPGAFPSIQVFLMRLAPGTSRMSRDLIKC
jgi:hypothetical protein